MRKTAKKALAVLLALVCAFGCCTCAFAAGEKYVADVKIATGSSVNEAATKLSNAGYTPIRSNLNTGNGIAVVLGYIATDNVNDAITDLAVMKEKGGYSFSEYEAVLEKEKTAVAELIENLTAAIAEFRENRENETGAALIAERIMNLVTDDDLNNRGMGDIFLDETTTNRQLETAFLQGNTQVCANLGIDLALACFGSESFLEATEDIDPDKTYPLSIDTDAKTLLDKLGAFQDNMNVLADLGITDETEEEEFETIFANATEDEKKIISESYPVYTALQAYSYEDGTLYDFFMRDLKETETSALYPIVDCMTPGQRATMQFVTFSQMIQFTATEDEEWEKQFDVYCENQEFDTASKVSLFTNVDRSIFNADGIALTNDALLKQSANNDASWTARGASKQLSKAALITLCVGVAVGVLGAACLALGKTEIGLNFFYHRACSFYMARFGADAFGEASAAANSWASQFVSKLATFGVGLLLICLAAVMFYIAVKVYDIIAKSGKHPTYSAIPRILVDESFNANSESVYTFYYCVTDTDGELADLNAWNGSKWNGLYYTKDKNAGKPITTTYAVQMGSDNGVAPSAEYKGVHYFGETTAYNLNANSSYEHSVKASNYTYLFFVRSSATKTASVFSDYGFYGLAAFAGLLLGGGTVALLAKLKGKKKKTVTA